MEFLYFLEGLRTPFLDAVMSAVTYCGDEIVFLALAMAIFWCVDKRRGYLLLAVGFIGTILNQILKLAFHIPRPWVIDPEFTIVESAREAATGYSFPSGHTQNAVGTFLSVAATSRRKWVMALCGAVALLVPFSRMYLGVHTPLDVGVAAAMAIALVAILLPIMNIADKKPAVMYALLGFMLLLAFGFTIYSCILMTGAGESPDHNILSAFKNAATLTGAILGICVAYPIERSKIKFDTRAPWYSQLLKLLLGLGIAIGLKSGLKPLFNIIFGEGAFIGTLLRYFLIVIFAALIWPMTFKFFANLGKKQTDQDR